MLRELFVIRQVGTEKYLCHSKHTKAGTASVLTEDDVPRIFPRRAAAVGAMQWWKQGRYTLTGDEDGYELRHHRKEDREAVELEVVPAILSTRYPDANP